MARDRKNYITFLNVAACLAVVLLHANGIFWTFSYERCWRTANVIECVFYFAVPVFFMISGATLLDYRKRYDTRTFFKKRLLKTLVPFLLWSLIGLVYSILRKRTVFSELTVISVLNSFLNCSYVSIYWFFPALFTVYLCIPIFGLIPEEKRKTAFFYIIGAGFLLNSLAPFICSLSGGKMQFNTAFSMPFGKNYLIYILLGYCIDRYALKKRQRIILYVLGAAGLLLHIIGTQKLSYAAGAIVGTFKGYTNVPCILYSAAIFAFAKYLYLDFPKFGQKLQSILDFFSKETFGIYLVHWYILDVVHHFGFVDRKSILFRTVGGVLIFFVSGILVKILRKIPYVGKYLLP